MPVCIYTAANLSSKNVATNPHAKMRQCKRKQAEFATWEKVTFLLFALLKS